MGCGGSTATTAPAEVVVKKEVKSSAVQDTKDPSKKYQQEETDSASTGGGTPRSPRKSPRAKDPIASPLNSPVKKKKKNAKMSPRGQGVKWFKKIESMSDLPHAEASTTTFTTPLLRQHLKTDKGEDITEKFRSLVNGSCSIKRPPPTPTATNTSSPDTPPLQPLTIHSDISPPFTINLTEEESAKFTKQSDAHTVDMGDLTVQDLLQSRMVRTKYKGANLRALNGFLKPLTTIAISSDDRLITTALGRSKNIPVRDAGLGLQICGSEQGSRTGSVVSAQSRNSSLGSINGQVKMEAMARIIRCIDSRSSVVVGMMKQKCFDPEATSDMIFTNEDQHLVSCSSEGSVFIWHVGRLKVHKTLEVGQDYNPPGRLHQVRVSPNGKTVAACGEDIDDDGRTVGQVPVWDVDSAKQILSFGSHRAPVLCLAFHPDSKHIASGDRHGTILLWAAATGEVQKKIKGHTISMRSMYFIRDDVFISADERFTRAWNAAEDYRPLWTKHIDEKDSVAFTGKFKPTGLQGADDESDESEEESEEDDSDKDCFGVSKKDGDENLSSSGGSRNSSVPQSPKCPKALLMAAPANQSKLRQRLVVPLPCGLLLSCLSIREVCELKHIVRSFDFF